MAKTKQQLKSTDGTHLLREILTNYKSLVKAFDKPNGKTDNYKTDAEWEIQTPYGVATIYNYKDGKNYLGDDGDEILEITNWHIGGHNQETFKWIWEKLTNKLI